MSGIDTVKAALAAAEAGDFAKVSAMITEDMQFAGPVPSPVGKKEFIGIQSAMIAGIPDWKFNAADFKEDGDKVKATLQITGTQTKELRPPIPGVQPIPASGKHVSLPKEPATFTIRDGKISRLETAGTPGAGVMGVLAQLGVPVPM
jgi:predicted ester cyclase